ncbi:MAG: hypothetical protein LBT00_09675 [Spirochaetaceae bacterium]|nr:hypothetical protein [Spirochaetaceae bacterium]
MKDVLPRTTRTPAAGEAGYEWVIVIASKPIDRAGEAIQKATRSGCPPSPSGLLRATANCRALAMTTFTNTTPVRVVAGLWPVVVYKSLFKNPAGRKSSL